MSSIHFSNIDEYLDTENCISVRWIANNLHCTMSVAQRIVKDYKDTNKNVCTSYLVSGVSLTGSRSFIVSSEEQLLETKAKFSCVNSITIYSIQKEDTNNYSVLVANTDCDQASDLLMMKHSNCEEFLHNKLGQIRLSGLEIKPVGERVLSAQAASVTVEEAIPSSSSNGSSSLSLRKESAESHISRVFANKSTAPPLKSKSSIQASSFFNKASSSTTASAPVAGKIATKDSKSSIFSKATSVAAVSSSQMSAESTIDSQISTSAATTSFQPEEEEEGEDAEWDDGTGYKVDKRRLAKRALDDPAPRRRVITLGDDDDEETVALDVDGDQDASGDIDAGGKKKKVKVALHVHGAMDSYMEDVAIAEYKSTAAAEASGQPASTVKRTKQKLVEKMFVDAKGYLVTETVMEDVTDDEGDRPTSSSATNGTVSTKKVSTAVSSESQQSQQSSASSQAEQTGDGEEDLLKVASAASTKKKSTPKAAPVAKKGDKSATAPQKNMMSFFGKK